MRPDPSSVCNSSYYLTTSCLLCIFRWYVFLLFAVPSDMCLLCPFRKYVLIQFAVPSVMSSLCLLCPFRMYVLALFTVPSIISWCLLCSFRKCVLPLLAVPSIISSLCLLYSFSMYVLLLFAAPSIISPPFSHLESASFCCLQFFPSSHCFAPLAGASLRLQFFLSIISSHHAPSAHLVCVSFLNL